MGQIAQNQRSHRPARASALAGHHCRLAGQEPTNCLKQALAACGGFRARKPGATLSRLACAIGRQSPATAARAIALAAEEPRTAPMKDPNDRHTLDAFGADPLRQLPLAPAVVNGKTIGQISDQRIAAELDRMRTLAYFQPRHIQAALYGQILVLKRTQRTAV